MALVELLSTPLKRQSHEHHLWDVDVNEKHNVKSRKAHMVGVVVVKWLIVAHQHHPNTHHQVFPKTTHSSHLCWLFHPCNHPLKEGTWWLCVSEETAKTVIEEWKGVF